MGRGGSQSLEKVTLSKSFFSITAWTDLGMSSVCSMLMFQEVWTRRMGKCQGWRKTAVEPMINGREIAAHQSEDKAFRGLLGPDWSLWDQALVAGRASPCS